MTAYLFPGVMGLLTGLLLHWTGLSRSAGLRSALALRRSIPLRSALSALGYAIAGTALLTWLAVIDVDDLIALPLTPWTLLGGALLGLCAGLCGFTPTTAFAGLGSGVALEALCTLAGCALMTIFLPEGNAVPAAPGSYLTQGCVGFLLVAIAICIPNPRPVILTVEDTPVPEEEPASGEVPKAPAPEEPPEVPDPESAPEDTFIAALEGEEPLVIDTEAPDDNPDDTPPD